MTNEESELIQKLDMSLDATSDLVATAAQTEQRANSGEALRQINWQNRQKNFAKLVDEFAWHNNGLMSTVSNTPPPRDRRSHGREIKVYRRVM